MHPAVNSHEEMAGIKGGKNWLECSHAELNQN